MSDNEHWDKMLKEYHNRQREKKIKQLKENKRVYERKKHLRRLEHNERIRPITERRERYKKMKNVIFERAIQHEKHRPKTKYRNKSRRRRRVNDLDGFMLEPPSRWL